MSITYIPVELRRLVKRRAGYVCEYCLIHEDDAYLSCHIEHIVSERHKGQTVSDNLAYSCPDCNRNKGSDIASFIDDYKEAVRLFNPRIDRWSEHFQLDGVIIEPLSDIGIVTVELLKFNRLDRIEARLSLQEIGRYPPLEALRRI